MPINRRIVDVSKFNPRVQLPYELRDPWFESLKPAENPGSVLYFSFPTQVERDPVLPTLNFTMFEATTIPSDWAAAHTLSDLIIVPTEHSRRAWKSCSLPFWRMRMTFSTRVTPTWESEISTEGRWDWTSGAVSATGGSAMQKLG